MSKRSCKARTFCGSGFLLSGPGMSARFTEARTSPLPPGGSDRSHLRGVLAAVPYVRGQMRMITFVTQRRYPANP
jgi:hypothetical protein